MNSGKRTCSPNNTYHQQTTYQPSLITRKNFNAVGKLESKGKDDLALGRHPTLRTIFKTIDGHWRNTSLTGQLSLAHQLGFTNFSDLVFHRLPFCYSEHNYMKLGLIIGILKQLSTNYIYMRVIWWLQIVQMMVLNTRSRASKTNDHNIKCSFFLRNY